jgi:hypothetical protein
VGVLHGQLRWWARVARRLPLAEVGVGVSAVRSAAERSLGCAFVAAGAQDPVEVKVTGGDTPRAGGSECLLCGGQLAATFEQPSLV